MKNIKTISIIGLGAIGCSYASKFYDIDPSCIRIIADKERIKKYKQNKHIINGKLYDFTYVSPEEKLGASDLVIFSTKFHHLPQAIKDTKNSIGEDTIILSFLNGISSEEIIGKEYGMEKLLYSMIIGIDAVREGNKVSFAASGKVTFGEKENAIYSEKVKAVKELFDRYKVPYSIPEDMMRTLWWKYMVNVGINQASAVLRSHYKVFQTTVEARNLMEDAMWEVINISRKIGINLDKSDIKRWYDVLYSLSPNGRTSMLEDIESGRKTEIEIFGGTVCELGEKYGVATPVNKTLFNIIKVMEQRPFTVASLQKKG